MKENTIKGIHVLIFTAAGAYFRELLGPALVLVIVMVIDYLTGMARAWIEKKISSRVGVIGVLKKIGYMVAVCVAIVVDWTIQTAAAKMGLEVGNFYMFGLLVTFWLVMNECISILENLAAIGVPLPPFLMKIVDKLKQTTEAKGEEVTK